MGKFKERLKQRRTVAKERKEFKKEVEKEALVKRRETFKAESIKVAGEQGKKIARKESFLKRAVKLTVPKRPAPRRRTRRRAPIRRAPVRRRKRTSRRAPVRKQPKPQKAFDILDFI